ncbi:MAG: caspase family protein, partial [Planctomycetia bacterium]|nr:caspase family protein [Planctomycetia bacterium]
VTADESVKIVRLSGADWGIGTTGRDPKLFSLPGDEPIFSATVLPKGNAVVVAGAASLTLVDPVTFDTLKTFVGHTSNVLSVSPSPDGRLFVTGSADQTIRIWQRGNDEPLLSIFVAGREWIAWTSQGYYACSAQGERLIAWQMQSSTAKIPLIHPAERFRKSMYKPALLKYLIPAGNMPMAMAMAKKFDNALVETSSVADVLPPEVKLEGFPESGELTVEKDKKSITIKATAESAKHPITAMRLLVNGRPFQGKEGIRTFAKPDVAASASWEVPITPGQHTFAVIADCSVSKGMSRVGVAFVPGEIPKPNLYVLAIGVSDYPGDMKLHYCATDAELLAKTFKEKSAPVFNTIEVKVLTDKAATKQGILDELDWLKSKMTPQDVGIVSFSGHGARDPFGAFYLVPYGWNDNDIEGTGLRGEVFKERLENMPGRLVAILDACHSGTVAEKNRPIAQADNLVRDLTAEDAGVIVMCASLGREYSFENNATKAGFFTFSLVEGMSGHGDVDEDGTVYINELDMYASVRVRQLSGGKQNPTLGRPSTVRPFALSKPGKNAVP